MPDHRLSDPSGPRAARELLAVLDATETFLRVMASSHLPIASVLSIERRAVHRADALLAELGVSARPAARDLVSDDHTDELLHQAVAPTARRLEPPPSPPPPSLPPPTLDEMLGMSEDELVTRDDLVVEDEMPGDPAWLEDDHTEQVEEERPSWLVEEEPVRAAPSFEPSPWITYDEPEAPATEAPAPAVPSLRQDGDVAPLGLGGFVEFDPEERDDTVVFKVPVARTPDVAPSRSAPDPSSDDDEDTANGPAPAAVLQVRGMAVPSPVPSAPSAGRAAQVETFDLIPDLGEEVEVEVDVDADDGSDDVTTVRRLSDLRAAAQVVPAPQPGPRVPAPRATPMPAARVAAVSPVARARGSEASVGGSVPTIRDGDTPKPRAAAVQLNPQKGTGTVLGLEEEEEPIEIGAAEDYDEDYDASEDAEGGFRLDVQEYEDDLEIVHEDEAEDDEVVQAAPTARPPQPAGPTASDVQALVERARQAAESGDMQQGAELYSDVIDADPDHVDAHVGRGRLYLDLGDYTRAMSDFMVAEDLAPESPEPQIAIGDLYFARKDYRKAIDFFDAALGMSPNHAMAFCRRGISHYYRKSYPDSLRDLQRAQQINPDIPNIATYIAMAKKKAKK